MADTLAPTPPAPTRREIRFDLLALSALALVLRIPAFLASAHLTFDDGVFGASAVAMRAGGVPFRDVFSSQGPAFLPLVWLGDLIGLRTSSGPRVVAVVAGLALVALVYLTALEIADRTRARLVAVLVAVAGSVLGATASMLFALRYRREPSRTSAVAIGVCIGLALMVKALVLPVALPIGLILLGRRRWDEMAIAVGSAVVVGLGLSLAFGFADVWDQSVVYHLDAPGGSTPVANARKLVSTFFTRDIVLVAAGLVTAVAAVRRRRPGGEERSDPDPSAPTDQEPGPSVEALLWIWLAGMVILLIGEHPMWRPHVSQLTPPVALLIAVYRPPWKLVALAVVASMPLHLAYALSLFVPDGYQGDEAALVAELEALPDDAVAISDEPGQVWRAGLRTPPQLVDASVLLVDSGRLTADDIAVAASEPDVCAVVAWSSRFGAMGDLPDLLDAEGYVLARTFAEDIEVADDRVLNDLDRFDRVLYLRPDCRS